ncbi:MAG: prephenate dehydrogenase/arogenate dehydrogenase family protein [Firmicutes bacterium]|nr:prephenate dehydrogenase/arogenate dehydrogenase family protein [Bacillota bacterium]
MRERAVAIFGLGLIGASVGLGLAGRLRRLGADPDPEARRVAEATGAVEAAHEAPGPWLGEASLVVLAAPPGALPALAAAVAPWLAPDAVVTDVAGAKGRVAAALEPLLPAGRYVPGHPMAGSERTGARWADPALFRGAVWFFCPPPAASAAGTPTAAWEAAYARAARLAESLGARPLRLPAALHDRWVARTSHLPYLVAAALAAAAGVEESQGIAQAVAGGFRDGTRVAAMNPEVGAGMCLANREELLAALGAFRRALDALEEALGEGREERLVGLLARARAARAALLEAAEAATDGEPAPAGPSAGRDGD